MLPRIAHIAQRVSEIERLLGTVTGTPTASTDGGFAQALQRGYAVTSADSRSTPEQLRTKFGNGQLDDLVSQIATKYGVDADLVHAVIKVESDYDTDCVSSAGASGLMQLMPSTARYLGVENIFDPAQNIDGGVRYLKQQIDRFGSVELALAAYNAGPGAVKQHHGIPPYRETQAYVPRVMQYYNARKAARTQTAEPTWTPRSIDSATPTLTRPGAASNATTRPRAAVTSDASQMLAMAPTGGIVATAEAISAGSTVASTDNPAPLFVSARGATPAVDAVPDAESAAPRAVTAQQPAAVESLDGPSLSPRTVTAQQPAAVEPLDDSSLSRRTVTAQHSAAVEPLDGPSLSPQTIDGTSTGATVRQPVSVFVDDTAPATGVTSSSVPTAAIATASPEPITPSSVRIAHQADSRATETTASHALNQVTGIESRTQTPELRVARPEQVAAMGSVATTVRAVTSDSASTEAAAPATADGSAATEMGVASAPAAGRPSRGEIAWQAQPAAAVDDTATGTETLVLTQTATENAPIRPSGRAVETDPAQIVQKALDEFALPLEQPIATRKTHPTSPQNTATRRTSADRAAGDTIQSRARAIETVAGRVVAPVTSARGGETEAVAFAAAATPLAAPPVVDDMMPFAHDTVLPTSSRQAASPDQPAELTQSTAEDMDTVAATEGGDGRGATVDLGRSIASQVAGTISSRLEEAAIGRQVTQGGAPAAESNDGVTVQRSTQGASTSGVAGNGEVQESVTIELSPPELGRVRIAFELRGGEARVNVNTEYAATASHLDQGFRALQSQFEDMGIRLTHLAVSCDASGDFQPGPGQQGQSNQHQPSSAPPLPSAWQGGETGESERAETGTGQGRQVARATAGDDPSRNTGRAVLIDVVG